jgi:hypothetical protein
MRRLLLRLLVPAAIGYVVRKVQAQKSADTTPARS